MQFADRFKQQGLPDLVVKTLKSDAWRSDAETNPAHRMLTEIRERHDTTPDRTGDVDPNSRLQRDQ
jgi:hypothetical protein